MTMKRENLREFAAIPIVVVLLGLLAVVLFAADAGLWAWIVVGIVVLVALVVVALVTMARPHHPRAHASPSRPAGAVAPVSDGVHRTLVIADDACAPDELGHAIAGLRLAGPAAVFVMAPALGSRTARWTGDEHAYQEAAAHLEATLGRSGSSTWRRRAASARTTRSRPPTTGCASSQPTRSCSPCIAAARRTGSSEEWSTQPVPGTRSR